MAPGDLALALFAVCNSVRVVAYLPQILAVIRDMNGASAISYTTWGLFSVSNLSTAIYAALVLGDLKMVAVFAANTGCCAVILGLTVVKRRRFKRVPETAEVLVLPSFLRLHHEKL